MIISNKMHKEYRIKKIIRETPKSVSLILDGKINYKPGQFVMLWLPSVDEKPFVVSYLEKNQFGITIEEKGIFTKRISNIKTGTKVGIRGPYGNGFEIKNNSIIFRGSSATEFSFRLTGKRFDWREHPTYAKDQEEKPNLIIK